MNAAGGNTILSGTSTTTVSNNLFVANSGISGGGAGTLTVQGSATLTATKLLVGNNSSRNGTVNQTGGTVNLTGSGANDIRLGHWGNLTGTYNLTGGTLNTLNTNFILGWDGQGILNVDGGTANLKGIHYGASTSVGTLNLDGGTLKLGSGGMTDIDRNGQSGNSTINLESGTLGALASWSTGLDMNLNGSVNIDTSTHNIDLSGDIAGAGTLTKLGTGALTLSGTGNTASELNVARGSLVLSGNSDTTVSGNLKVSLSGVAGGGVGSLTVQDSAVLNVGGNFNVGQNNSTNGSVTQTGGTINMSGDVTMGVWSNLTATYTISGGTLNVQNNWLGLGNDGKGFLNIDGGVVNAKGVRYGYNNNGSRAGTLNLDGGTLNVGSSGMYQEINGTINLNSGTLGSLASWSTGMGMNLGGAVDINTTGGDISLSGALAGAGQFTKTGSGTLTLSGANTFSGNVAVSNGTLATGADSVASFGANTAGRMVTVNGASSVLDIGHTNSLGVLNHSTENNITLEATGGGQILGSAGQNRIGDVNLNNGTLTANVSSADWGNFYFGKVNSGQDATITVSGTTASTIDGTGNIALGSNTQFDVANVTGDAGADLTVSAIFANVNSLPAGGLTKKGAGTMELTGANTYTGTTTVNAGTLSLASGSSHSGSGAYTVNGGILEIATGVDLSGHTMTIAGVISPGNSPGTAATGSQTWLDGGSYLWEINDSGGTQGADSGWDWLDITGTLDLSNLGAGGFTIDIDSLTLGNVAGDADGFGTWIKGDEIFDYSFTIATASSGVSGFDAANFTLDYSGFSNAPSWDWGIVLNGNSLVLQAFAVPEPSSIALLGLGALALSFRRKR
jgi:autotransporter-associated beta strand protein